MRSDSDLQIFTVRCEKIIGRLLQSDVENSDGIRSDLRIRWLKSSDFRPKSNGSANRIPKSNDRIGL